MQPRGRKVVNALGLLRRFCRCGRPVEMSHRMNTTTVGQWMWRDEHRAAGTNVKRLKRSEAKESGGREPYSEIPTHG